VSRIDGDETSLDSFDRLSSNTNSGDGGDDIGYLDAMVDPSTGSETLILVHVHNPEILSRSSLQTYRTGDCRTFLF
jgi:hypothetical protein